MMFRYLIGDVNSNLWLESDSVSMSLHEVAIHEFMIYLDTLDHLWPLLVGILISILRVSHEIELCQKLRVGRSEHLRRIFVFLLWDQNNFLPLSLRFLWQGSCAQCCTWVLKPFLKDAHSRFLQFTNTWFAEYMPWVECPRVMRKQYYWCVIHRSISSRISYDNTGVSYNVTKILTPESTIDLDAYHNYSPLFISWVLYHLNFWTDIYTTPFFSTTFAISYGWELGIIVTLQTLMTSNSLSFASITATLMHAFLYFRKQIWVQARRSLHEQADIHARLMARYPQGDALSFTRYLADQFRP